MTHTIKIDTKKGLNEIPKDEIVFVTQCYDKPCVLNTTADKANYFYTMLYNRYNDASLYVTLNKVKSTLVSLGIPCKFTAIQNTPQTFVSAKSDVSVNNFLNTVCEDGNLLYMFLFSDKSEVIIENER